jgi:acetyl esterase
MAEVIAKQNELAENAYSTNQTISQMRDAYNDERAFWNEGGPVLDSINDTDVETPFGAVRIRVYRATAEGTLPAIFYIHGGGYVLGNLDTHDRITRTLAAQTGAAVIAIDYTLAPEAKYPQAIEECLAVVHNVRANAQVWDVDPENIAFAGDSGGANLGFATYVRLREELGNVSFVRAMLLFYGSYGLLDSESMRLFGGAWDGLSQDDFAWYMNLYTRDQADLTQPYFNILGADLTENVPPCFIAAAALDPLRDDSRTLNAMLSAHGTPTHYEEIPGVIHGFLHHSRMLKAARDVLSHASRFYTEVAGARQLPVHDHTTSM